MLSEAFLTAVRATCGPEYVLTAPDRLDAYASDALKRDGRRPDAVVIPRSTAQVSAIARLCCGHRVLLVPRGAGTGYTGGAVATRGGIIVSLERFTRILDIDERNLLAVVEPGVITGQLQAAVERVGLFYPPDPASLDICSIGGNIAENAGGPRAFKYGTTRDYVLGLEAVLPTGEVVRTGGRTVKNVVGYDLTRLIVGSEGTLAIVTKIVVRLIPRPTARMTLRAMFMTVDDAVDAVAALLRERVVPAALELVDAASLAALASYTGGDVLAPTGTGALLLIELDGLPAAVAEERQRVQDAIAASMPLEVREATSDEERDRLWRVRRDLTYALRALAPQKYNHDVVVPKGRIPELFRLVDALRRDSGLAIPCFGHAGDGNIHVNVMVDPADGAAMARAEDVQRRLFEGVVALEGSISGEHGIGFTKAPYLEIELAPETIALMKRVKTAFDPFGILNPGKIFPS